MKMCCKFFIICEAVCDRAAKRMKWVSGTIYCFSTDIAMCASARLMSNGDHN